MRSKGRLKRVDVIVLTILGVLFGGLLLPISCGKKEEQTSSGDGSATSSSGSGGGDFDRESRGQGDQRGGLLGGLFSARDNARRTACANNLRQLGIAFKLYVTEYDRYPELVDDAGVKVPAVDSDGNISTLPARSAFALLMKGGYVPTTKMLICPASDDRIDEAFPTDFKDADLHELLLDEDECSYGWDPTKTDSGEMCALIADKPPARNFDYEADGDPRHNSPNHRGAGQNVVYTDGHVKWADTPRPDVRGDADMFRGEVGYEDSTTDAFIRR